MTDYQKINPTDCSDEDIINFIENVRGDDTLHYKSNWIVIRALKILFKTAQNPAKREDMKDDFPAEQPDDYDSGDGKG